MSSISTNLAGIIEGLKARNADPAQDPAKALRRLQLPGPAKRPYTDVVHMGASDLGVVARTLDDERESLEMANARAVEAAGALTQVEDLLKQATDLVTSNANGAGPGRRKSNQRKVDELLGQVDDAIAAASAAAPDLFAGRTTLKAGDAAVEIGEVSRESLGRLVLNGRVLSLADVERRGALDTAKGRTQAEGARKSLADATKTVTDLRERLGTFQSESVRPRLGDIADVLAGLFNDAGSIGTSETAVRVAQDLRDITLASSTAALSVGADGWDRDRVLELLT